MGSLPCGELRRTCPSTRGEPSSGNAGQDRELDFHSLPGNAPPAGADALNQGLRLREQGKCVPRAPWKPAGTERLPLHAVGPGCTVLRAKGAQRPLRGPRSQMIWAAREAFQDDMCGRLAGVHQPVATRAPLPPTPCLPNCGPRMLQ